MTTRREARQAQQHDDTSGTRRRERHNRTDHADRGDRADRPRKPLLRRARFWVPTAIILILLVILGAGAWVAKQLADDAFSARDDLEKAFPLVDTVQEAMLEGDSEKARTTAEKIGEYTASAARKTSSDLWQNMEWVPVAGPNLHAVRTAAATANTLVRDAVVPLTDISFDALAPRDGAINIDTVRGLADTVAQAATSVENAQNNLATINRDALIDQVSTAVGRLDKAIDTIEPVLEPAHEALSVLPAALGGDGPRNYLLLFQNNAESRGTGGNPAAIAMLTANDGHISMADQAASGDFNNQRNQPIVPLDPETEALYGDKIGRWVMDTTLTPDFPYTSELVQAFWAESYGTPVDGVASFDPVALSYLLEATGPVELPTGETLTSDNAVSLLLNQVYFDYPTNQEQDIFFAAAAASVFDAILDNNPEPKKLLEQLIRAADEGRLMYAPNNDAEAALIAGTKVSGTLPTDNSEDTITAVYVNDITEGKLDYYMQLDIAATTTQCEAPDSPTFTTTATLTNTLTPEEVDGLARYIAPGRFFTPGDVSTDLVIYGPVDATIDTVTVNGKTVKTTAYPHLGRTAIKVNVITKPGATATVTATYAGAPGEYGDLSIRHTPMVRDTPTAIDAPGCQ
ncbi:DUF4012 domain-containing protein [Microbacterium sp. YY-01]|uniref:DUF4012 domain-containing protein n=1 Tax=Microbacterium sp. YY-01 TaxID=3421634 RepID=UPI003D170849